MPRSGGWISARRSPSIAWPSGVRMDGSPPRRKSTHPSSGGSNIWIWNRPSASAGAVPEVAVETRHQIGLTQLQAELEVEVGVHIGGAAASLVGLRGVPHRRPIQLLAGPPPPRLVPPRPPARPGLGFFRPPA